MIMKLNYSLKQEVGMEYIRKKLIDLILLFAFMTFVFPCPAASAQETKTDKNKIFSEIVGDYSFTLDEGTFFITFSVRNGSLVGYDHDDAEEVNLRLVDLEKLEFETENYESVYFFLKFFRDEEGKISRMLITSSGREIEGEKIK